MKYTGKMDIGGSGIGRTAFHQVKPLIENGLLKEIWSPSIKNLPNSVWREVPNINAPYVIQDIFFDGYTALNMKTDDIIHSWTSHCLFTFRENPKAIKIVNQYSAHPEVQKRMLKEEPMNNTEDTLVKKMSKELELADHIIIPSDFIYKSLREFDLEHKAKIIPFGVNTTLFAPATEEREDDIFRVIFVGNNWARKGLIYLIAAWKQLDLGDKGELIVAGAPEETKNILQLHNEKNIKWGWVPDLVKAYQSSDMFILPAVEDGCPLATYEAMACGITPVVSAQTGTYQHIMHGHNGFVVPPRDAQSLYDLMSAFKNKRESLKRFGKNARETIESYTWERHEQEYLKFIEEIKNEK